MRCPFCSHIHGDQVVQYRICLSLYILHPFSCSYNLPYFQEGITANRGLLSLEVDWRCEDSDRQTSGWSSTMMTAWSLPVMSAMAMMLSTIRSVGASLCPTLNPFFEIKRNPLGLLFPQSERVYTKKICTIANRSTLFVDLQNLRPNDEAFRG